MDAAATLLNAAKISISDIFEKMFYMPVEFEERAELESIIRASSFMSASLGFTGVRSGRFNTMMPMSVLKKIASDFMGTDEEDISQDDIKGTLGEIINMIAGNALTMVGGDFHLDLPELPEPNGTARPCSDGDASGKIFVKTLSGVFCVSVSVH